MDESRVEKEKAEAKGIGNSVTLPKDVETEEEAGRILNELAESVSRRLRNAGQKAGMLSVEIKYHTFTSVSHQKQVEQAINQKQDIYMAAMQLFRELWNGEPIRLLGIRSSKLVEESEPRQLSIFDIPVKSEEEIRREKKIARLDAALDKVRKKYGKEIVKKGQTSAGGVDKKI